MRPGAVPGAWPADQRAHLSLPALPEGDELAVLRPRALSDRSGDGDRPDCAARLFTRALARLLPRLRHASVRRAAERGARRHRACRVRRPRCPAARVPLFRVVQDQLGAPQRRPAAIPGMAAGLVRARHPTLTPSPILVLLLTNFP